MNLLVNLEVQHKARSRSLQLTELYACGVEHLARCHSAGSVLVLVGEVDNLGYTRLNYSLCTLVAREESNVQRRSCKRLAARIKNSVELCVNNVLILGVALRLISVPGELIVGASVREAVVSGRENSFLSVNDASANLGAGVL